jgi:tryptophanyl-tRNA synthetase
MASDILLYDTDLVPVGSDQKQHVEYARDIAGKFNHIYSEAFKLPEEYTLKDAAIVLGTDGRKMSKSYANTIPLFASDEEIKKVVMSIVTDSGSEIPTNVYEIHKLVRDPLELKAIYEEYKGKYKALKEILIEDLRKFIAPMRERRAKFERRPRKLARILAKGAKQAKAIADKKLAEVKRKIGVL